MENLTNVYNKTSANSSPIRQKAIFVWINEPLIIKCRNFLTGQHLARDYTYSSLSDLVRKSLIAYQEKKLTLTTPRPDCSQNKKQISLNLPIELFEY